MKNVFILSLLFSDGCKFEASKLTHRNPDIQFWSALITLPTTQSSSPNWIFNLENQMISWLANENISEDNAVFIGISESCLIIPTILKMNSFLASSAVAISGCLDRVRTPFSSPIQRDGLSYQSNSWFLGQSWYDWRLFLPDRNQNILLVHSTGDLNPSTPFIDAYSYYEKTSALGFKVKLLQCKGHIHGGELLQNNSVYSKIYKWIKSIGE